MTTHTFSVTPSQYKIKTSYNKTNCNTFTRTQFPNSRQFYTLQGLTEIYV